MHIEEIAEALNRSPLDFDAYHLITMRKEVEEGDEWVTECAFLMMQGQACLAGVRVKARD